MPSKQITEYRDEWSETAQSIINASTETEHGWVLETRNGISPDNPDARSDNTKYSRTVYYESAKPISHHLVPNEDGTFTKVNIRGLSPVWKNQVVETPQGVTDLKYGITAMFDGYGIPDGFALKATLDAEYGLRGVTKKGTKYVVDERNPGERTIHLH